MKILFVHEVNYLDKVVFEMHEFPERLAMQGHEVIFIDYSEKGEKVKGRRLLQDRQISGRSNPDASLRLITIPRLVFGTIDRLLVAVAMILFAPIALRRIKPDVVISYAVPTLGWQFNIASRVLGIPFVYRAIDVSHKIRSTPFARLVRKSERFMYRNSTLTLFNNKALQKYGELEGCPDSKSSVLFPGFDSWPLETGNFQKKINFDYNTVFLGTLFSFCGIDWFLDELVNNKEANEISLLIIGDGELKQKLVTQINDKGLSSRVQLYGRAEYEELPALLRKAKVAVIPFAVSDVTRFALPGKVPQYIRSFLPTVSTPLDGLMSFLPEGHGVVYVPQGRGFVDECTKLLTDPSLRENLVALGIRTLDRNATWPSQTEQLEGHLSRITKAR